MTALAIAALSVWTAALLVSHWTFNDKVEAVYHELWAANALLHEHGLDPMPRPKPGRPHPSFLPPPPLPTRNEIRRWPAGIREQYPGITEQYPGLSKRTR